MRRHRWRPGDDAVSPVIGAVLLVGIAVTLMAAIGVFVLGVGPGGHAPESDLIFSQDDTNLTVTVVDGGGLVAEDVSIRVGSQPACYVDGEWSGRLQTGDEVRINGSDGGSGCTSPDPLEPGDTIRVVWEPDNAARSDVIAEYEYL